MNTATQDSSAVLRQIFLSKKERNPSYSTRAFARDIDISQAYVSMILSNKKPLTLKQATRISAILNLPKDQSEQLINTVLKSEAPKMRLSQDIRLTIAKKNKQNWFKNLGLEHFAVMSRWYHFAIMDLTTTSDFVEDTHWIAARLGIGIIEARDALSRLIRLGLLKRVGKKLKKYSKHLSVPTDRSQAAIRNFHKDMIGKAIVQLDKTDDRDFKKRSISGTTFAINPERLDEAKKLIFKFQQELSELLTPGKCTEVYQLNVQLFPLTQDLNKESANS